MSSYISSFLIEPVYRQARRFSRLSAASDSSQLVFGNPLQTAPSGLHRDLSPPPSIEEDVEGRSDQRTLESYHPSDTRAQVPIPSPPPESDVQGHEPANGPPELALGDPSEVQSQGVSVTRRSTIRTDSDTSMNPSYGVPESLRSSSGILANPSLPEANATSSSVDDPAQMDRGHVRNVQRTRSVDHNLVKSGSLPEDDGMALLRRRIHEIREQEMPSDEKALLVHGLMNEQWTLSQASLLSHMRPYSPTSFASLEQLDTPQSPAQNQNVDQRPITPSSLSSAIDLENPYNVSPSDRVPTYAPQTSVGQNPIPPNDESGEEEEEPELGCAHYKRNVKLQCYTCKRWYTCRFCHDEVEDHSLNRKETRNMLCMFCGCAQPASQSCKECGESAAWYYCPICKLWDNDIEKSIYHCNDCGICRVGKGIGKDFFHCKTCCACMSITIEATHRCIERSTQCDCPICGDYMFTSPDTVVFMRCGHSIHSKCFFEYSKTSYRCPICSRSITNMETQFRNLDRTIRSQPMPPEFQDTKALVYCNDCSAKTAVKYHWLGLKCDVCDSYNTAQLQLVNTNETNSPSAGAIAAAAAAAASAAGASSAALPQDIVPVDEVMPASAILRNPYSEDPTSQRATAAPNQQSPTISPYSFPQRAGRSVSSLVGNYFGTQSRVETETPTSPIVVPVNEAHSDEDGDEDDVDFWGGESPRDHSRHIGDAGDSSDSDDDEDDMELVGEDDLEEDDDDDEDHMEIFGHR